MTLLAMLLACGDETDACAEGFGRAEDGNCYPLSTGDDDDDDDDTLSPTDGPTGFHSAEGEHTGTGCAGAFTGPLLVMSADVRCDPTDTWVTYDVETQGWSSGGFLYQIETGSAQPWADEHDLESYAYDPCGAWDKLGLTLEAGVSIVQWERNGGTLFTCSNHFEQGRIMTYAAAVMDLTGAVADCLAWGEDPEGVVDGDVTSPYNYESGPSFDPSICVIGVSAL